jgi:hypothetical protein
MKTARTTVLICKDKGSRSSSQRHCRMAAKLTERFRHSSETRTSILQSLILLWSCLLLVCVMGIPMRKGWKRVHYKERAFDIPEAFVVQQGKVPLLSLNAVFFWSSWSAPYPLVFASIQHQQFPPCPKDPIRPMPEGSPGASFGSQKPWVTLPSKREAKRGAIPCNVGCPCG